MIKSYRIRLYPTKEQEQKIWNHIGSCRFIWNYMLNQQSEYYNETQKFLSAFDMIKMLTPLKKQEEFSWLKEVSNTSLQIICSDLAKAMFDKTKRFPRFKSKKRAKTTYPVCTNLYFVTENELQIQKLGHVKYKTDFTFPVGNGSMKFINPRISFERNKYMLSFGMEYENQVPEPNDYSVGIDLGVKELAHIAYGNQGNEQCEVFGNINKSRKMRTLERQKRHLQRTISRKYEANKQGRKFVKTNNILRAENKLRRICERQRNIRDNNIHQITHYIISLHPQRVVMEDLNVSGMMKNKHLSKAISESGFYKFISTMQYKCEWNGIEFVQVPRFYPSSKTCSACGNIKTDLKLSDRVYICSECGLEIDRDDNAALNLCRYAA